jgi:beta-glucosidase
MLRLRFGQRVVKGPAGGGRMATAAMPVDRTVAPRPLPDGFLLGAATSAYQIEGAATEDGRGRSIWDVFSHMPGKVRHGDTGDVACDSYHRYREDVSLLSQLGLSAYRFSISWPRILPTGRKPINHKGLDYYKALVEVLKEHSIAPVVTLYHWDLPQALEDEGGWAVRATAEAFAEYAVVVANALGVTVERWITLNEPQVVANHGYRTGEHAPGIADLNKAAAANHHLLLGHGLAVSAMRSVLPSGVPVGVTLDLHPIRPAAKDIDELVAMVDAEQNGCYLEPILYGRYPLAARPERCPGPKVVKEGDLQLINAPIDFLGINYYFPIYVRYGDWGALGRGETRRVGHPGVVTYRPEELEQTSMGWLVEPDGLYDLLHDLHKKKPDLELYVTENGCTAEDYVSTDGKVHDLDRVKYLHLHLDACARAIANKVPLRGYFVWSLLDNFEWSWGFQKRFGVVFVDFGDRRRLVKDSGWFLAKVAKDRAVPPLPERWPT